jgi:hypothetical protein
MWLFSENNVLKMSILTCIPNQDFIAIVVKKNVDIKVGAHDAFLE